MTISYRSLVNLKSWPKGLYPTQNVTIVGMKCGYARSFVDGIDKSHLWKYYLDIPEDKTGKEFNKSINNIMFANWLQLFGYDPCDERVWNEYYIYKNFWINIESNHPVTRPFGITPYMLLYHGDSYRVDHHPHFSGHTTLQLPVITFKGFFPYKEGIRSRFELVKTQTLDDEMT